MIKIKLILFVIILLIVSGCGQEKSYPWTLLKTLEGDYCYPNCENPNSAMKFNSDGTFNSSTSAFGGVSRWGSWEELGNNKIKLTTTRISTNSNSDKIPELQIIKWTEDGRLEIGNTLYNKKGGSRKSLEKVINTNSDKMILVDFETEW